MSKRFRRTPEEIAAGLSVEEAKVKRVQEPTLPKEPEGLGDKVEKITKATGIKAFVEFLNGGEPCEGCEKRKEALNKLTFRRRPKTLTEKEVTFSKRIEGRTQLNASEVVELFQIHARIFNYKYQVPGNCASCVKTKYNELQELYKAYKSE
jgi:hypothetical protein